VCFWLVAGPARPALVGAQRMTVGSQGFQPRTITAKVGEGVRVILTAADGDHCFAIDPLRIERRVKQGETAIIELNFDRPGTMLYYCCLENDPTTHRGEIVIRE
jgi:heme/copper-type cytochrome/quinol oxidase subunit 2